MARRVAAAADADAALVATCPPGALNNGCDVAWADAPFMGRNVPQWPLLQCTWCGTLAGFHVGRAAVRSGRRCRSSQLWLAGGWAAAVCQTASKRDDTDEELHACCNPMARSCCKLHNRLCNPSKLAFSTLILAAAEGAHPASGPCKLARRPLDHRSSAVHVRTTQAWAVLNDQRD